LSGLPSIVQDDKLKRKSSFINTQHNGIKICDFCKLYIYYILAFCILTFPDTTSENNHVTFKDRGFTLRSSKHLILRFL